MRAVSVWTANERGRFCPLYGNTLISPSRKLDGAILFLLRRDVHEAGDRIGQVVVRIARMINGIACTTPGAPLASDLTNGALVVEQLDGLAVQVRQQIEVQPAARQLTVSIRHAALLERLRAPFGGVPITARSAEANAT
jgi:hypothetical protein